MRAWTTKPSAALVNVAYRGRAQAWTLAGTFGLLGLTGVGMAAYQRFVDPAWMMLGRT